MSVITGIFKRFTLMSSNMAVKPTQGFIIPVRYLKEKKGFVVKPKPGNGQAFRRIVHFPETYTVEPLQTTNLGGRDPVTGRKVCEGIGGGIKHKYHWIKWTRNGPSTGPPQEEKVIKILKCGCRTADIALVAFKDEMKYILATENMKAGDIIKTSKFIPQNPVRPNEGDAYPLGALPMGTRIHNLQIHPSKEYTLIHAAGSFGIIKRQMGKKIVVQLPSKQEVMLHPQCMATVGRLSNIKHASTPIGSAQKARQLGYRPRSGKWHRKTGRFGRKIKKPKPITGFKKEGPKTILLKCTHPVIGA